MSVLIVESDRNLADIWIRHLTRGGAHVVHAANTDRACEAMLEQDFDVLLVDLDLDPDRGGALTVADFASYRRPNARVIFVTAKTFFSDGSIFQLSSNAAGFMASDARPEDLCALVEHHSRQLQDG